MADVWIGYSAMLDRQAGWIHASTGTCQQLIRCMPCALAAPRRPLQQAAAGNRHTMPHTCRPRSVLTRVHAAYAAAKERAERAEASLELSEAALAQERAGAEAYKVPGGGC